MIEIRLEEISKAYAQGPGIGPVLDKINLVIEPGEFFFLLGPSGCGKTTLLRILAGLLEPTSGRILFDGRDVTRLAAEKRRTAMVFQNYALWPHLKVIENVEFGPQMQGLDAARRRAIAMEKLAVVQMDSYAQRKPNQLSGGQQQRVALARALAAQPECLLLDEPLSNLDARLRAKMRTELRRLVKESQTTAVYVTHDQKEALSMADRIAVLCGGRIVQVGTPQEIYQRPQNEFVADFIGEANFLTGNLLQTEPVKIRTEAGILASAMKIERPAGTAVKCCVRPEKVQIHDKKDFADRNRPNLLAGTVLSIAYYGELSQVEVRLTAQVVWTVSVFSGQAAGLSVGKEILCGINPADVIVLEG
jgi:iron(III) transport system ATP-binding protein